MAIAFSDEPHAIFLPKTRLVLTDTEISRRLASPRKMLVL